jgi:hypothetical protein
LFLFSALLFILKNGFIQEEITKNAGKGKEEQDGNRTESL